MIFIPTFLQLWVVVILTIFTYIVTFITTRSFKYNIWQIEMFNLKPLNCHLCSFCWLNIFISINLAYINPFFLLWFGITTIIGGIVLHKNNLRK